MTADKNTNKSYFRSHGYTPDEIILTDSGESCDLSKLPPFLRTLLVMDGTVTKALEAWFWEPVKVVPLKNELTKLTETVEGLATKKGDKALQREVILQGVDSEKTFACARSTVALESLPTEVGLALETGQIGIGELFREKGLETYRELFNINYFSAVPKGDVLLAHMEGEVVSRSYQIWVNGSAAIIVTEYFSVSAYKG
ncbi:MAG: chorismate lyase [Cocleimonas sp.]|nr:chorismate lyase [Cocleimonas sp.]